MDKLEKQLILIQRRTSEEEEHGAHGIWKIAYADFMTALMAFFLIMWLLNATNKDQRTSIANYFNPIKLADISPTRKGVEKPQETPPDDVTDEKAASPTQKESANPGASERMSGEAVHAAKPRFPESVLFMDPYAILAKLAAEDTPGSVSASQGENKVAEEAPNRGSAVRDPFDPAYWRLAPDGQPSSASIAGSDRTGAPTAPAAPAAAPPTVTTTPAAKSADKSTNASKTPSAGKSDDVSQLKEQLANALKQESHSPAAPAVDVKKTNEGLLISLTDAEAFSMFAIGSAEPTPAVVRTIERISKLLSGRPGNIIVRGHTDSTPFKSNTYDNWRLSSARAQMAAYMLIRGGIPEQRIERIEGHADRSPLNASNTRAPENRRIEILLREK